MATMTGDRRAAIRPLLRPDAIYAERETCFDCLPPDLRARWDIVELPHASSHEYDPFALEIVDDCRDGWVLDCGAGYRRRLYPNVVNFEVEPYPSTDVLGVAEVMPFKDASFDGVLCLAVLEHVKDPFQAAREIARVLKPGGRLYCVVPFLQALHGYPHHYYNMTAQGLRNLFDTTLRVDRQLMLRSGLPIWSISWFLQSWLDGLQGVARDRFARLTVAELAGDPMQQLDAEYVTQLPDAKNFELASTTAILATKPMEPRPESAGSTWSYAKLQLAYAERCQRMAEMEEIAAGLSAQIENLDKRLNRIRRSRWWRLRRVAMHLFGFEDGVD